MLVHRASAQGREDVAGEELLAQVLDKHFAGAGLLCLVGDGLHVVALPDVADHGDHVARIVFLQPGNDDRGIKTARIREDYLVCHGNSKVQVSVSSLSVPAAKTASFADLKGTPEVVP